ncbi:MAG: magnesium transporter, partial [Clostridiales bacterium]|nr:magnesium transporter [Clostridiales bacterium]
MALQEYIIELLNQKKYAKVHSLLLEMNAIDVAEFLGEIPEEQMLYLFRLLPKDISAEVFSNLDSDMQEYIVKSITDTEIHELIDMLFIDDT